MGWRDRSGAGSRGCRWLLVATGLALTGASPTWADSELLVVVNPSHPSQRLGVSELRPIFKVVRTNWPHGEKATPINLPESDPNREVFDRAVLGLDPESVTKYWIDRKIRGDGRPPRRLTSAPAVVAAVAADSGAVGYVPAGTATERVKVVARIRSGQVAPP